jgi:hypothetical protein
MRAGAKQYDRVEALLVDAFQEFLKADLDPFFGNGDLTSVPKAGCEGGFAWSRDKGPDLVFGKSVERAELVSLDVSPNIGQHLRNDVIPRALADGHEC